MYFWMKEESTLDVGQPLPQEKEKPAASVSVVADSQSTPAMPIGGEREAEPEEGGEMEETPVRVARTARKTFQRSKGSTSTVRLASIVYFFPLRVS